MIARAAEGGMRDALSLLDQAISFADDSLQLDDVLAVTGAVSQQSLTEVVASIHQGDTVSVLQRLDQLLQDGKDPLRFIEDVIYYFRDMLLYKNAPQAEDMLERAKVDEEFKQLATETDIHWLYATIESLNASQQEMKWSAHPKIFLELALIKLVNQRITRVPENTGTSVVSTTEVEQLKAKVQTLEKTLQSLKDNGMQVTQSKEQTTPSSTS